MTNSTDLPPGTVARQLTNRDYLSYSAVATFMACPLKYFFRYVANAPETTVSASLAFGRAIHAAVEWHFTERMAGNPSPGMNDLLRAYYAAWANYNQDAVLFPPEQDRTTLDSLANRMLEIFEKSPFAEGDETILAVEEELRGDVVPGCPELLARVDLIIDAGPDIVVTDLKTSRSRWSVDQVDEASGQLLLYHELVRPLADGKPIRLEFAVLTKTKSPELIRYPVLVDQRKIDRTKRIVERVWNSIVTGHFYPNPGTIQCRSCPFRGPCRDWLG